MDNVQATELCSPFLLEAKRRKNVRTEIKDLKFEGSSPFLGSCVLFLGLSKHEEGAGLCPQPPKESSQLRMSGHSLQKRGPVRVLGAAACLGGDGGAAAFEPRTLRARRAWGEWWASCLRDNPGGGSGRRRFRLGLLRAPREADNPSVPVW